MRSLLKARLAEAGMTQKKLAQAVGVSAFTVNRWANDGIGHMTIEKLCAIADAIGCEPEDIYER